MYMYFARTGQKVAIHTNSEACGCVLCSLSERRDNRNVKFNQKRQLYDRAVSYFDFC